MVNYIDKTYWHTMKTKAYFTPTSTKGKTTFKSGKNGSEELKVLCQSAEVAGHQMNKRIDPRIFHKNTAEDYLQAEIETANWIDTLAVKTEHGRIWKALPEGQDGYREDVPMFTSKSMYDGSAGIGIFLIRLYEATSDERWLKEAEEAAAHIIATQVGPEWYEHTLHSEVKGIIPVPGWAAGSYNGPVGEAYFLEDLYQVTRKQEYREVVLRTADVLMEAASRDERGLFWSEQEDITADGGFIVFLDIVYRRTGIRKYLDFASEAAEPGTTAGGEPSPPEL